MKQFVGYLIQVNESVSVMANARSVRKASNRDRIVHSPDGLETKAYLTNRVNNAIRCLYIVRYLKACSLKNMTIFIFFIVMYIELHRREPMGCLKH